MASTLNENSSELKLDAADKMAATRKTAAGWEIRPFDSANPCQLCVLSEDQPACELAMQTCDDVMARCGAEFTFACHFWKFNDLNNPASAQLAAEALACADVILFSMQIHELPPTLTNWLEACFHSRIKAEGLLALVVPQSTEMNPVLEILVKRMRYVANQLRMDFLPPAPGLSAIPSPLLLDADQQSSGWSHWGLNE